MVYGERGEMQSVASWARLRSMTTRERILVIERTDHPHVAGRYFYWIPASEKRKWTPGETLITAFEDGEPA